MAKQQLNIALLGTKFMGKAHSNGLRNARSFFDLPVEPVMKVVVGRDEEGTRALADDFGWQECSTDWQETVHRDDIDIVDVSTPGFMHHPMVLEAARAGKHIICEKPLALDVPQAEEMLDAVQNAGVKHMCGFSYRFAPAVCTIKKMIADGQLGTIYHFRSAYQQDWIMDPDFPVNWRLQKDKAGSGSLGDIGAHSIDMCRHLVGEIEEVSASMRTFIKERPVVEGAAGIAAKTTASGGKKAEVTVDDAAVFLGHIKGQETLATFEATRFASGRRNNNAIEVYGSKGGVLWNQEDMNLFWYFNWDDPEQLQGFRRVHATDPGHPYTEAWWPSAHIIGYEHLFIHELHDFLTQLDDASVTYPTFVDGYECQKVLAAVEQSAQTRQWVKV